MTEATLWMLANAVGVGFPVATIYLVAYGWLDIPMTRVSAAMTAAAFLSLSWGSWSALVWSEHRVLRAAMQIVTVLPGVLLIALAGVGFYVGQGALVIWLGLLATGLGTVAASFMLARRVAVTPLGNSAAGVTAGFAVFPVLATAGTAAVAYLWYLFVSDPLQTDWRAIFSMAFFFVTTLAMVLVSTVVPALATVICRRLCTSS